MGKDVVKKHSAGGVLYKDGKYLIIEWVSQKTFELPKGTINASETAEEACVREIKEETGYAASILTPLSTTVINYTWSDGIHYEKTIDYFLMTTKDATAQPEREDHEDFINMWCSYEKARELLTFDHAVEALDKASLYVEHSIVA